MTKKEFEKLPIFFLEAYDSREDMDPPYIMQFSYMSMKEVKDLKSKIEYRQPFIRFSVGILWADLWDGDKEYDLRDYKNIDYDDVKDIVDGEHIEDGDVEEYDE